MAAKEPCYPVSYYADLFSLTTRRIQQLATDGVIPKEGRGKYPLIGTVKGYVKFLQERSLGAEGGAVSGDLQAEKTRLTKANADKTELEVKAMRGEYISAAIVQDFQSDMVSRCRARLLAIPTKSAHELLDVSDLNAVQTILKGHIYEAIRELSEYEASDYGISDILENNESMDPSS